MSGFWAAVWRFIVGSGADDDSSALEAPARHARSRRKRSKRATAAEPSMAHEDVVVMPIEDAIDLHTFQPREIASVVDEYLREARRLGLSEVRVIHGRGKGVQRARVRSLLKDHPSVQSFRSAPHTRGGWGATLVVLKPPKGVLGAQRSER